MSESPVFNDDASSDLIVIAYGTQFRCHRDVLGASSNYVAAFLNSPIRTNDDRILVALPPIRIPAPFASRDDALWFEMFLEVAHDQRHLTAYGPGDIFAMVAIADFMMAPSIVSRCDFLLFCTSLNHGDLAEMSTFCQSFRLPRTLDKIRRLSMEKSESDADLGFHGYIVTFGSQHVDKLRRFLFPYWGYGGF